MSQIDIKKAKNGRPIRIQQPETIIERLFTMGSIFVRPVWPNRLNTSESDPEISENPTRFESLRCPWDSALVSKVTWRSSQFSYLSTNSNIARIGLFSVVLDVLTYSTISQGYMLPSSP